MLQLFGNLVTASDIHISYLPLAHGFENLLHSFGYCFGASCGFYHGDVRLLTDDAQVLRPTLFVGVPRVYQRIHQVVMQTFESKPWFVRAMIQRALSDQMYYHRNNMGRSAIWDLLVFNKVKAALGGRVRYFFTGSAPLSPALQEFLQVCFNAPMFEGYGLTETSAITHVSTPADRNVGHVGPPMPSCEMKLESVSDMNYTVNDVPCPRGEVLLRGPSIMKGYFGEPQITSEVLDLDGWLRTGDIGRFNRNGTLSIIDRKKNIFKLSQGEYISAERIEGIFLQARLVGQIWVYGNSYKDCLVAVVVPDPLTLIPWALENVHEVVIPFRQPGWKESFGRLISRTDVAQAILSDVIATGKSAGLNSYEIPKRIIIEGAVNDLNQGFSVDNDLLTPTFKLKRPALLAHYQQKINDTYDVLETTRR
jgi:long-chain acyl-CoA synthetase